MTNIWRILFVAVLTLAMVGAGVSLERFWLSPLAEKTCGGRGQVHFSAEHRPISGDCPDFRASTHSGDTKMELSPLGDTNPDSLPPACLAELADMSSPARDAAARTAAPPRSASLAGRSDSTTPGQPDRLPQDLDPSAGNSDAAGRVMSPVRTADWIAPAPASSGDDPAGPGSTEPGEGRPRSDLAGQRPAASSRAAHLAVSVEESLPPADGAAKSRATDVLDLMRQLRSDEAGTRDDARRELQRRGFGEVDLELARQLFSPDAEARKRLARAVPRLSSVDAVQWLLWLAADPQPEVRMAAVTMLATTGDPILLAHVEALARKDGEPQIQAVAEQIAKQRDFVTSRGAKGKNR